MTSSEYERIEVQSTHEGQLLRIILSNPPGNVLDARMMGEISACLEAQKARPDLKAIVFEGAGKHFCFGASVQEHRKEQAPEMIRGFHGMFKQMLALAVPTIALVRGQCLGGGMELASFCNFVIAEPGAKFGQPEIKLAVFPPVAALILPQILGQLRADDLILTGRAIDAVTAQAWGLVHTVVEDGEEALLTFVEKRILPKSAEALRYANRASRFDWGASLVEALDRMERFYVDELMETEDANEGIASFLEKRTPVWKNR
jgi:cyclohexa-1,5-dienecarbonyl-CoA hydratase